MLLTGLLTFSVAIDHADARRMGGGKSFGSFSRSADRPAASPSKSTHEKTPNSAGSKIRRGGMGGMLGGMLAGGLLAALFFGGAFDELRLMDMLIMAGVAVLAFYAFRMMRQNRPAPTGPSHTASGALNARRNTSAETTPESPANSRVNGTTPAWFDKERFLGGAKEHFMTLQRAWDNNDLARIQDYVTPELYNLLREERSRHAANNRTDTVRLLAELGSVEEHGTTAEATVIFHGLLEENGEQAQFNETWHLTRQLVDNASWYVQGIEQTPEASPL